MAHDCKVVMDLEDKSKSKVTINGQEINNIGSLVVVQTMDEQTPVVSFSLMVDGGILTATGKYSISHIQYPSEEFELTVYEHLKKKWG